jgi:hypothetical protein
MGGRKSRFACSGAEGTEYTRVIGGCGVDDAMGVMTTDSAGRCAHGHWHVPDLQDLPMPPVSSPCLAVSGQCCEVAVDAVGAAFACAAGTWSATPARTWQTIMAKAIARRMEWRRRTPGE